MDFVFYIKIFHNKFIKGVEIKCDLKFYIILNRDVHGSS